MKRISTFGKGGQAEINSYICSTTEFEQETDCVDGSELQVVDETTHKVVSYHIAYHGHWNKR